MVASRNVGCFLGLLRVYRLPKNQFFQYFLVPRAVPSENGCGVEVPGNEFTGMRGG